MSFYRQNNNLLENLINGTSRSGKMEGKSNQNWIKGQSPTAKRHDWQTLKGLKSQIQQYKSNTSKGLPMTRLKNKSPKPLKNLTHQLAPFSIGK